MCKVVFQKLKISSQITRQRLEAPYINLEVQISAYNIKAIVFLNHFGPLLTIFFTFFSLTGHSAESILVRSLSGAHFDR